MNNRPSDCESCRRRFMATPLMRDEMTMIAIRAGASAAQSELDERWQEWHDEGHDDE